ncbi:hypothetical protein BBW65_02205 [Helicobacter enhydrae]|uniref:Penicillin-binding protein 2 n=1 Tax=Helicobacter enhydrae TaxID=222136 RepID=A0A1B1U4L1_9HELI|nr:penicillin-binding protein 2 [Helicobacter enhydrae]ANV97688.1 hypothetical protein BBW65_02205 [Helicobacter enhydrae]
MPNQTYGDKNIKALGWLVFILCGIFVVLVGFFGFRVFQDRRTPTLNITKPDYSTRGNIYSRDGFTLATSEKLYKVSLNPKNIDPDKKELFVNLFSIYTGIPKAEILQKLKREGYVTLSYNISAPTAANLKLLHYKLDSYKVFKGFEENGKEYPKMGFSVDLSGYSRQYPYGKIMEPLIGYTQKLHNQEITKVKGIQGIESSAEVYLKPKENGKLEGLRDVGFNIIKSKDSTQTQRQDGFDITLSIPITLQTKIENIIDAFNQQFQAKEILVGVMDSRNGQILSLASSGRFNPKDIKKEDYPFLNNNIVESSFEPGSIIKPIIYAFLLQKHLIPHNQLIDLNNGIYQIGKHIIRDDHPMKSATPHDILIKSSNIGMIKLTQNLNAQEYYDALKDYGFGSATNIDLGPEETGVLPNIEKLKGSYKASTSYGYGFRATFIQILRAYASFSNGGFLVTPTTINYISRGGERYVPFQQVKQKIPVISSQNAQEVKSILQDIVRYGTGKKAGVEGVLTGGKTGTARIFLDGKYTKRYNSSFFGFAQDEKRSYTIGVVVFDPNVDEGRYYGSKTAAPIFAEVVKALIANGFLQTTN